jgi:hypothetical protein
VQGEGESVTGLARRGGMTDRSSTLHPVGRHDLQGGASPSVVRSALPRPTDPVDVGRCVGQAARAEALAARGRHAAAERSLRVIECHLVRRGEWEPAARVGLGSRTRAATRLGLSRQGLLKLLVRLGLERRPTARTSDG